MATRQYFIQRVPQHYSTTVEATCADAAISIWLDQLDETSWPADGQTIKLAVYDGYSAAEYEVTAAYVPTYTFKKVTPMKLYRVSMKVEAVVLAKNETEAQLEGQAALEEELGNMSFREVYAEAINSLTGLPPMWSPDSLVYHEDQSDKDITVREALKLTESSNE